MFIHNSLTLATNFIRHILFDAAIVTMSEYFIGNSKNSVIVINGEISMESSVVNGS